jgi:hypothetical protein
VHSFDIPRRFRLISQRLADLTHAYGKCGIGHRDPGPDSLPEIILGNQLTGMLDQIPKHLEGLRRQKKSLLSSPQRRVR